MMYPMSTVEPTYKMILVVVKALLEADAPAKAVLAAIGAMEETIEAAKQERISNEEIISQLQPWVVRP